MGKIIVNGSEIECSEGEVLLDVLAQNGIDVPTLCHHDSVKPAGVCRVCLVGVTDPAKPDKVKFMQSCVWKVKDGTTIDTEGDEVQAKRAEAISKVLAYAPSNEDLLELAEEYEVNIDGVEKVQDSGDCILCGLCVRVCEQVIGLKWTWKRGKGYPREVAPPEGCIGCLSCAYVCPTSCIETETTDESQKIWNTTFEMHKCTDCGVPIITAAQRDWLVAKDIHPEDYYDLCDACKRVKVAGVQKTLVNLT